MSNESRVNVPAPLWDDLMLALDQCLRRIEALDPNPGVVTRQIYEFGDRTLRQARHCQDGGAND